MDSSFLREAQTIEQNPGKPGGIERALELMAEIAGSKVGLAELVAGFENTTSPDIARALMFFISKNPGAVPDNTAFEFSLRVAAHYRDDWHDGTMQMALGNLAQYWDDAVAERFDLALLKPLINGYIGFTGLQRPHHLDCFEDLLGAAGRFSFSFLSADARAKTVVRLQAVLSNPDPWRKDNPIDKERDQRLLDMLLSPSPGELKGS